MRKNTWKIEKELKFFCYNRQRTLIFQDLCMLFILKKINNIEYFMKR